MKKKICFVIQALGVGGSSKVVFDLLNVLKERDDLELSLIVFFDGVDERYKSLLSDPKIKSYLLGKKRTVDFAFMRRLKRTLKEVKPNIISTHLTCVFYLNFFVNYKKTKVFHTIHNTPETDLPKPYRMAIRRRVKKGDIVLIPCQSYLVPECERVYGVKIQGIDNGIPAKPTYTEGNRDIDVFGVGRLTTVKKFADFFRVVAKLKEKKPDIKAVICGYGPEKENLLKLRTELSLDDNVTLEDENADPNEYYARSKCFLLCSSREGAPIVILEANSFGVPVIATAVGGVPNMIREGENGYLFDYTDVDKAASLVWNTIKDDTEWRKISNSSYQVSLERTDKVMADKYLRAFLGN